MYNIYIYIYIYKLKLYIYYVYIKLCIVCEVVLKKAIAETLAKMVLLFMITLKLQ